MRHCGRWVSSVLSWKGRAGALAFPFPERFVTPRDRITRIDDPDVARIFLGNFP